MGLCLFSYLFLFRFLFLFFFFFFASIRHCIFHENPEIIFCPGLKMCEVSDRMEKEKNFPIWKNRKIFFQFFLMNWIICSRGKFSGKSEIFPLSNFFEYSGTLWIRACKCANFQTEWRKWKFFQLEIFLKKGGKKKKKKKKKK